MAPRKLIFFPLLLFAVFSFAQTGFPPTFQVNDDTADYSKLDNAYWQILEDPQGILTIDDVERLPYSESFHRDSSKIKGVNNALHVYWFRARIRNNLQQHTSISFFNIPYSEQFDIYVLRQGKGSSHFSNGVFVPYSRRDGLKEDQAIVVLLDAGEEITIYKRIYRATQAYSTSNAHSFGFVFTNQIMKWFYDHFDQEQLHIILHAFTFGILLLACVFGLFFYYINREKVYLFFAAFLFFEGLVFFELLFLFFLREYPKARAYLYPVEKFLTIFFLVQFIRYLLHTRSFFPRWDKLLVIGSLLPGVITMMALFIEPVLPGKWSGIFWIMTTICSAFIFLMLITTLIFCRKEKDRATGVILIAVLPALFVWMFNFGFLYLFGAMVERFKSTAGPSGFLSIATKQGVQDVIQTICLCWMVLFFSWILFLRYSQLRKENAQQALDKERLAREKEMERALLIEQQNINLEKQVDERTAALKQSLEELKSTQAQLIQSEKMASLGELTAGIAHEIQNPLNFVNNFSEVNNELISELLEEVDKGNVDEVKAIVSDIKENEAKISHHGKRADAIVRGMLQHSRTSSGQKEPTDINKLADEYVRLAYHGLRAKDKSFHADFQTAFDETIDKIKIVPQDIGRVLLNLFNNAFYAVNEKAKMQVADYEPQVVVETKKLAAKVEIVVRDNGNGISQNIVDKIFQPFFTTKPTGQGTGLGLSLAYDIIKAHGGEIKVENLPGEGVSFIITLPR